MHPANVIQGAPSPRPGPIQGFVLRKDPVGRERRRSGVLTAMFRPIPDVPARGEHSQTRASRAARSTIRILPRAYRMSPSR